MEPNGREHVIDQNGKSRAWHTAFYYLAEHIRSISEGRINHKDLYALVGVDGWYVNHANPLVRKRTAGALSRIVHSKRYVEDMQSRYNQSSYVFGQAASSVCEQVVGLGRCTYGDLAAYLQSSCWADVRRGLENEKASLRPELDLFRIDREISVLFDAGADDPSAAVQQGGAVKFATVEDRALAQNVLASFFYIMAFGHLEFQHARALMDRNPTGVLPALPAVGGIAAPAAHAMKNACLVKFANSQHLGVLGSWLLSASRPFMIGRYTDCDVVETDASISRIHGCIYRKGDAWHFEDMGSRNGSSVRHADGSLSFDSRKEGSHVPIVLEEGDEILLSDVSRYWFGAAPDQMRYSIISR